jgi:excisionase family DNA binding protein
LKRRKSKEIGDNSSILTADEVAGYLKLSKITVYKLAKQGKIPGFRVGGSWRFNRSIIEEKMK